MDFFPINFINFAFKKPPKPHSTNKFTVIQSVLDDSEIISNKYVKDTMIVVNFKAYEEKIRKSYDTDSKNIYKQLFRDINRCDIYINDRKTKDAQTIIDYFTCEYGDYTASRVCMFCTQAVMALPCEILYNIYGKEHYVAEAEEQSRYFRIRVYLQPKSIIFRIEKNMRILDENGNTHCTLKLRIEFDILRDIYLILSISKSK